jgi:hypothetical protein
MERRVNKTMAKRAESAESKNGQGWVKYEPCLAKVSPFLPFSRGIIPALFVLLTALVIFTLTTELTFLRKNRKAS